MAWTTPRTWTTGELVTAALLNTHLRDNLNMTAPAVVTALGQLVYGGGANALQVSTNYRLYETQVTAPNTVGDYVEVCAVPTGTYVWAIVSNPGILLAKAYSFMAYSGYTGHDIPPCTVHDPTPTSNSVVLEHVWDSTNSRVVLRLRRQAGTTSLTPRVLVLASGTITPLSGTGTSSNDRPILPTAQRGWVLVRRSVPTSNVTSVTFSGLRVTKDGGLMLLVRAGNPTANPMSLHLRINGEADNTAWVTQHFDAAGTATAAARYSSDANIGGTIASNGLLAIVCHIGLSQAPDPWFVSQAVGQGGNPWLNMRAGWRSGNPSEITSVQVIANQTNGIAAGSCIELYQLPER